MRRPKIRFPIRFSNGGEILWDRDRMNGAPPIAVFFRSVSGQEFHITKTVMGELVRRANRDFRRGGR